MSYILSDFLIGLSSGFTKEQQQVYDRCMDLQAIYWVTDSLRWYGIKFEGDVWMYAESTNQPGEYNLIIRKRNDSSGKTLLNMKNIPEAYLRTISGMLKPEIKNIGTN
jgi:hypothetical protein